MAKQVYTTGQILTAAQMTTLQANDYNQTVSAKTASYTLVAADAGTRITMSNAGATAITVNTSIFTAGDTLEITNIGAGICTVTAGTATVSTSSTLALQQFDSGQLYFTSTGVAIFFASDAADGSSGPAFFAYRNTTSQSVTTATDTKVEYNAELFDTDNCFDSTTNYRFTPTKAGYYQLNSTIFFAGTTLTREIGFFFKNGAAYTRHIDQQFVNNNYISGSTLMYLNGTTDYAEVYVAMFGTSLTLPAGVTEQVFSGVWIRS